MTVGDGEAELAAIAGEILDLLAYFEASGHADGWM